MSKEKKNTDAAGHHNLPDKKTLVISIALLVIAAVLLSWLGMQLWNTRHLGNIDEYSNISSPEPTVETSGAVSTDEPTASEAPSGESVQQDSAPTSAESTPEPEYEKTFGLDS